MLAKLTRPVPLIDSLLVFRVFLPIRSFRLSLAGGLYAKLPGSQGNWLSHPSSTFVCEISGASGFKSIVNGTLISANYSSSHASNFVNNVIIECDVETASFIASVNGTFRYFFSVV